MFEFIKGFDLSQWDDHCENVLWVRREEDRAWTKVYCPTATTKFAAWFYGGLASSQPTDTYKISDWLNS